MGQGLTSSGKITLLNASHNRLELRVPASVFSNYSVTFSASRPELGSVPYFSDSSGQLVWLSPTTNGFVLSLAGGVPVWTDPSTLTAGSAFPFADFYALMPGDNAATIAVGAAVLFPQDGASSGISRSSNSQFILPNIGTYEVFFQVSVDEAGQLMLRIDGVELAHSVVGRATGTNQLTGMCMVTTTATNSILEVINPSGNSTALTITPIAGGTHSVSAHLVVKQIK